MLLLLGHSSVSVTANIYAHAFGADELKAAEVWDQAMAAAVKGQAATQ